MSRVFFTSDLHLGHKLVAQMRGYQTPEQQDRVLAYNWDHTVSKDDTVWVLGDLCAGGSVATRRSLAWIDARPGVKHLITGNHDAAHPMHRDAHRWQRTYLESGFESVQAFARRRIQGHEVLLSHFPYAGDSGPTQRFEQYRLACEGLPIVHGHTHSSSRFSTATYGPAEIVVPQVHVGVDAWGMTPVPLESVAHVLDVVASS